MAEDNSEAAAPAGEYEKIARRVLSEHFRGDWSDYTYSCQGCRNRYELAEQAKFDALDREPTRAELIESRNGFSAVSHPGWSVDDYNAHVAEHLIAELFPSPAPTACDHPGIDHATSWSYCRPCPKCGVCKFIGHGPLCADCGLHPTATS